MWVLFSPALFVAFFIIGPDLWRISARSDVPRVLFEYAYWEGYFIISVVILYRTTANYFAKRKTKGTPKTANPVWCQSTQASVCGSRDSSAAPPPMKTREIRPGSLGLSGGIPIRAGGGHAQYPLPYLGPRIKRIIRPNYSPLLRTNCRILANTILVRWLRLRSIHRMKAVKIIFAVVAALWALALVPEAARRHIAERWPVCVQSHHGLRRWHPSSPPPSASFCFRALSNNDTLPEDFAPAFPVTPRPPSNQSLQLTAGRSDASHQRL